MVSGRLRRRLGGRLWCVRLPIHFCPISLSPVKRKELGVDSCVETKSLTVCLDLFSSLLGLDSP